MRRQNGKFRMHIVGARYRTVRHYVCFVAEAPHVGGKAAAAVGSQRAFVPDCVHFAVVPAQHKQGEGAFEHICRFEHRLQRVAAVVCLQQVSHHFAVRVGSKEYIPHKLAQLGVVFYDTVVAYGKIAVRRQKGMGVLSAHLSVSCPPRVPYRRLGADIFRKAFGKLPYAPFTLVQQNIPCQRRYTSRIVAAILQNSNACKVRFTQSPPKVPKIPHINSSAPLYAATSARDSPLWAHT